MSTVDVDLLVEALALPSLPYPLETPSPGITVDERRRLVAEARAELTNSLADALELLALGQLVVDGRLAVDHQLDLVGVVRGTQAVLAVQTGDTIQLSLVHDSVLLGMITGLLPEVRQLNGSSTSIPRDALTAALTAASHSGDLAEFEQRLTQAGVRDQDVRVLAELVRANGIAAQFGVGIRTPATDVYRERRVWTWYATEAGGVLLSLGSSDAPAWTTLVPADPARVGQYLGSALYALKYGGTRVV